MSKKTFVLGLAAVYLFSTLYYLTLANTPIHVWIFFQLLGLFSVFCAVCFFMAGILKKPDRHFNNFIRIVKAGRQKHKMKFHIAAVFYAVLILVPVAVMPIAEVFAEFVDFVSERLPFLDWIPFPARNWLFIGPNAYALVVYMISYYLLFRLLCRKETKVILL